MVEEVDESHFWLEFAVDEKLIKKGCVEQLIAEAVGLTSIFVASRKAAQKRR